MKAVYTLAVVGAVVVMQVNSEQPTTNQKAENGRRVSRQTTSADQMVQNILQWLQGVYTQNARRIRQGTLREYLPPSNTQKPRPFQPQINPEAQGSNDVNDFIGGGYPPAGSITPQPPFPIYTSPAGNGKYPGLKPQITPPIKTPNFNGYPGSQKPSYPTFSSEYPSAATTSGYPGSTRPAPGYLTPSTQQPGISVNFPSERPTERPGTSYTPGYTTPAISTEYPSQRPDTTVSSVNIPTNAPSTSGPFTSYPSNTQTPGGFTSQTEIYTSAPGGKTPAEATTFEDNNVIPTETAATITEEDLRHPPHIHAIDVECAKEMMTINIEFNRAFDGVIYSKGFYSNPECRYVKENSGQTKYSFTVSLNSCGTEFVNAFDTQGQSYLENVLVLQNEPGIQEVWDTIRSVRCLWEGNLNQALSVALSVGMLTQEIVTFSGDTAMARLDIQLGRGPFAKPANGLVKIGELMTLAVTVSGDAGFDIQVKDCKATDSTENNVVALTDENGCVLKPKLFGAFQKTRNTGNTGASIIAYAFFNAFKFPDVMDIMIECNIELCKTDCQMCTDPDQKLEPGRRRRRSVGNETLGEPVTMGKTLRVFLPEDIDEESPSSAEIEQKDTVCVSINGFILSSVCLVTLLAASFTFSAYVWLNNQRLRISKQ